MPGVSPECPPQSLECPTPESPWSAQPQRVPGVPSPRVSLECPTPEYLYQERVGMFEVISFVFICLSLFVYLEKARYHIRMSIKTLQVKNRSLSKMCRARVSVTGCHSVKTKQMQTQSHFAPKDWQAVSSTSSVLHNSAMSSARPWHRKTPRSGRDRDSPKPLEADETVTPQNP